ncbi:MAG TPA: GNAT family N-acetyltransferase [Candidatus Binatia bacterium]|jgi:GNAT superfamily N-acetyltransferase
MIAVRAGRRDDVAFVFDCIHALAVFEKLEHQFTGSARALEEHLFGASPSCELLVAEKDGRPGGYALFFTTYSTFLTRPGLFLEDLFVLEKERGSGVGRSLLTALAAITVERGCGRLEWSVLDWNERAIRFYRSLGAAPVTGWTPYRIEAEALAALARRDPLGE